jgi:hypothetical protein
VTAPRLALAAAASALVAAAPAAAAEPAVSCHCYRDRRFDLARPAAADPYILATTRSSLLSAAFGVPKADLVRTAMTGTAAEDLWIAHWTAARLRREPAALLAGKAAAGSWNGALRGAEGLDPAFARALAGGASDEALAALAVDDVLVARLRADPALLAALRRAGASSEEAVLASVLALHVGAPTLPLLEQVRAGRATWGTVLDGSGLAPEKLDGLVRRLVR